MTDNHVQQKNPILFAPNTISSALIQLTTMLTDWTACFHYSHLQQSICLFGMMCRGNFCHSDHRICSDCGTRIDIHVPAAAHLRLENCRVECMPEGDHLQNSRKPIL